MRRSTAVALMVSEVAAFVVVLRVGWELMWRIGSPQQ